MKKWIVSKLILGAINKTLAARAGEAERVWQTFSRWVLRLEQIVRLFRGIIAKLQDGKLDEDEAEAVKNDVADVLRNW